MTLQKINKNMVTVYKLLTDLSKRKVTDKVYEGFVLYACLRLQREVYTKLLDKKMLRTFDLNNLCPTLSDIENMQEYLYSVLDEYLPERSQLVEAREEYAVL